MANELYTAGGGTYVPTVTAATAIRMFALAIGERDTSILRHPTLQADWQDHSGLFGALLEELPILGLGLDLLTARSEGQAAPNIEPSSTSVTPTTARFSGRFLMSGLARKRAAAGTLDAGTLIQALITGGELTLINSLAAMFPSITALVGTTGTALTVAKVKSALNLVRRARADGQAIGVFQPYQWEQVTDDGMALGGAFANSIEAQRMIGGLKGGGYQGRFFDGQLDVYVTDKVDTVGGGADYSGCVWAPGAFAIRTEAPPAAMPAAHILAQMGWIRIESDRDASEDDDKMIAHAYHGVVIAQQSAACEVISKVP